MDVVNEPLHAVPSYSEALGGEGETGWDWVVWAFKTARGYFPDARLILNEYGILGNNSNADKYLVIINILKEKGLIDGIGVQGHGLETAAIATVYGNLNKLAATGIPIYVSEYDVNIEGDAEQRQVYLSQFPVLWEHPGVAGITLWGYIQDQIWKTNAYLIYKNGSERSAMIWLKDYVMNTDIECGTNNIRMHDLIDNPDIRVFPNPASDGRITVETKCGISELRILDIHGRSISDIPVQGQTRLNLNLFVSPGLYLMQFISTNNSVVERLFIY
jgi:endo-1,4-beta-xylanase